ncbi:MAG: tryptophan--tRNA ligase [Sphingomonadaceae bacterium]
MIIVSGIQPTGNPHLGNYLGAIRNWVLMQDALSAADQAFYFIADMHAITLWQDPRALGQATREIAATLMAAGVDPERVALFNQSRVREHAELAWILGCTARIGWLSRMTQFKEKSGKDREGASVGLYTYPVLQAADILLYKATHVPVGDDQKQHLELTRDIATKFNTDYARDLFVLPEPTIPPETPRVRSLRDGSAKMSKSDPSDMSRINLTDTVDDIRQKIKKAKTDPEPIPAAVADLAHRPEARNLIEIYATFAGKATVDVLAEFAGEGFGKFKPALAELIVEQLAPINERFRTLLAAPEQIDGALNRGADAARTRARETIAEVRDTVGFLG